MISTLSECRVAARFPSFARSFAERVRAEPAAPALQEGSRCLTYHELGLRVRRLALGLRRLGLSGGDRIAVVSENRAEYLELKLAAAQLGAAVACQNWRQAPPELAWCIALAEPKLVIASPRFAEAAAQASAGRRVLSFGDPYESLLASIPDDRLDDRWPEGDVDPELPFTLLYTSGTTGKPKAAILSQRAIVSRALATSIDRPMDAAEAFVAWTPLFHMGSSDHALATFLRGAKVIVMDGFDAAALAALVRQERLGWLHVMPGTSDRLVAALRQHDLSPTSIRYIGVMADLMPRHRIAELTQMLRAPYANTFGSTEAGGILSRMSVPIGEVPSMLAKRPSALCTIRLADEEGCDVPDGEPGELLVRSPCLFSGYWADEAQTRESFRDGWFHSGDVFVRHADGSYTFVDRRKYLIKSGGENIYPAEIERILMASPDVAEAVVVRRRDEQWGEVPVAFVVRHRPGLTSAQVMALCDGQLARYKRPREVRFIAADLLPRSTSGKIIRSGLEGLAAGPAEREEATDGH